MLGLLLISSISIFSAQEAGRVLEYPRRVAAVAGPLPEAGVERHMVLLDRRWVVWFDDDPGLEAGDVVIVRRTGVGKLQAVIVDGAEIEPSTSDTTQSSGLEPAAVAVLAVLLAGLGLILLAGSARAASAARWGLDATRSLRSDLAAPLVETSGRYRGSWSWRGLTRKPARHTSLGGVPVAIEVQPGEVRWFGANRNLLEELVRFEEQLAAGDRHVEVAYHPESLVLARLSAADGSANIELGPRLDTFSPASGLHLKVSHWRPTAHLPDR